MAWTNWGFDGTINEAQWSQMAGLLGNGYVAAGNGDCVVTAVAGARSVSVAAGTLYGDGVVSVNSAPETVAMTTPVNGQWYVIALRRTWATNTAALVAIAGATTSTTTPTTPPTSFPTLNTQPGVLTDQPIAWAWCNSANTTVVIYDIRLKAVKSMPPVVANAPERDAKFMAPYQGLQVWQNDLGSAVTYYDAYNVSTNPGGRDTAGWYRNTRQSGLVPIVPPTVVAASGTATASALGVITFNNVTSIDLQGVFSSSYTNYKFVISDLFVSGPYDIRWQFTQNGSTTNFSNAYSIGYYANTSGGVTYLNGFSGLTYCFLGSQYPNSASSYSGDILNPASNNNKQTTHNFANYWNDNTVRGGIINCVVGTTQSFDGYKVTVGAGTMSGRIQILGYVNK